MRKTKEELYRHFEQARQRNICFICKKSLPADSKQVVEIDNRRVHVTHVTHAIHQMA